MKCAIVHISDLHVSDDNELLSSEIFLNFTNRIKGIVSGCESIIFALTGDLTDKGAQSHFTRVDDVICSLRDSMNSDLPGTDIHFIFTPGNHDNDLSEMQSTRNAVIDKIRRTRSYDINEVNTCCSVQANFFNFASRYGFIDVDYHDKLIYTGTYNLDEINLYLVCINTSWLSQLEEKAASVQLPLKSMMNDITIPDRRIVVALLHHPLNWLDASDINISESRFFVSNNFNVLLTGHEHLLNASDNFSFDTEKNTILLGSPKGNGLESGCNVLILDTQKRVMDLIRLKHEDGVYKELPRKQLQIQLRSQFNLSDNYEAFLDDVGIQLSHPGKDDLCINDVFVEPDLKVLNSANLNPVYISLTNMFDTVNEKKVFFIGRDQSGKTTIFKRLIRDYYENSVYPVLIRGSDIVNSNIDKLIKNALGKQYSDLSWDAYMQLDKSKRVIFIDDLDHSTISTASKIKVYDRLKDIFAIIFSSMRDTELYSSTSQKSEFYWNDSDLFEILPFGHAKKDELIKRWVLLSSEEPIEDGLLIRQVDGLYKKIQDITLTKIPSYPFYLLMILQGITTSSPSDYKFTAYGDCYLALIVFSIHKYIGPKKSEAYLNFLSCLSYDFFVNRRSTITDDQLKQFYTAYSQDYNVPDDMTQMLNNLLKAKLLHRTHDDLIKFNHPYVLHFCIARYLARNYQQEDIKAQISDVCQKIHVFRNANIVIFLTHFLEDDSFWDELQLNVTCLFDKYPPESLCKENTDFLNDLFSDLRDLIIEQKRNILENRDKILKQTDEITNEITDDDKDIDHVEEEEQDVDYSILNDAQKLIRYLEIIGQILKNRSGSLKRGKIKDFLSESINSSLRLISFLIQNQKELMNTAITYIRDKIKEEIEVRNNDAKKNGDNKVIMIDDVEIEAQVKRLLLGISFSSINSLLFKTAVSLGSNDLLPQLDEISKENPYPSYRLIDVMVCMEYKHCLNVDALIDIKKEHKDNLYVFNVLRHLIYRFLYMHEVDYRDQQRIAEAFEIKIKEQMLLQLKQQR
ncbi:MAG: metallophosphoesterase [Gammaproteobacteria bacterium]